MCRYKIYYKNDAQKDSIIACVKILEKVKSCRADLNTEETYFAFSFQYGSTSGRAKLDVFFSCFFERVSRQNK